MAAAEAVEVAAMVMVFFTRRFLLWLWLCWWVVVGDGLWARSLFRNLDHSLLI
jgi:hypothetical protein